MNHGIDRTDSAILSAGRLFQAGDGRGVPYTLIALHIDAPIAVIAARVPELAYAGWLLVSNGGVRVTEGIGT